MRPGRALRVLVVASLLAVLHGALLPSVTSAAPSVTPPATFGVVFVNGMGNTAPEAMDPEACLVEGSANNLSKYFNLAQGLGYRTFMIQSIPGVSSFNSVIDSTGNLERNGEALGSFLRRVKAEKGITDVAIVAHSMGGLVARQFIEQGYDVGDASVPRIRKLMTIGTPHAGFHPAGDAYLRLKGFGVGTFRINFADAISQMTPAAMENFNAFSFRNSQVPYVVIGSHVNPPLLGRLTTLRLWNYRGAYIDNDSLVYEPSAMGYDILSFPQGESILGAGRKVTRYYATGKWHGLPAPQQAKTLGIAPQQTLTFDSALFDQFIAPELQSSSGGGKRVMFETSKGQTLDDFPEWVADMRAAGYSVTSDEGDLSNISEADVLVVSGISNNYGLSGSYSVEEAARISAWVEGGGSLMLMADHSGFSPPVQPIAESIGVSLDQSIYGWTVFGTSNINARHPLMADVASVQFLAHSLVVSGGIPVMWIDSGQAVAVVVSRGSGRAAVFTDTNWAARFEGGYGRCDNARLAMNTVDWLASR